MPVKAGPQNPDWPGVEPSRRGRLRTNIELFLISFMILFFELAWIRWLGSTVIFLTFFTNIVLIACFLGVSVGCLAASQRRSWIDAVVPLALVTAGSASGFLWAYNYVRPGGGRGRISAIAAIDLLRD